MGTEEKSTSTQQSSGRRGNIRPKSDLVKSMYVRLAKWAVTEPFGLDPDYVKGVKYLGKFVAKTRKCTPSN